VKFSLHLLLAAVAITTLRSIRHLLLVAGMAVAPASALVVAVAAQQIFAEAQQ
jgi:hypothetical protein